MVDSYKHTKGHVVFFSLISRVKRHAVTKILVCTIVACIGPKYVLDLVRLIVLDIEEKLLIRGLHLREERDKFMDTVHIVFSGVPCFTAFFA